MLWMMEKSKPHFIFLQPHFNLQSRHCNIEWQKASGLLRWVLMSFTPSYSPPTWVDALREHILEAAALRKVPPPPSSVYLSADQCGKTRVCVCMPH